MTTLREAAQQALEALEFVGEDTPHWAAVKRTQAITALRDALAQQEKEDIGQNLQSRLDAAMLLEERRQEIAQPRREAEQEPVAYTGDVARRMREARMTFHLGMPHAIVMEQMTRFHDLVCAEASVKAAAAFATPPRREWQSLSEEEIDRVVVLLGFAQFSPSEVARAIAAKLKEKNNG